MGGRAARFAATVRGGRLGSLICNDTMAGGLGNDVYVVDSASDVVTEAASAGTDTVQSTVTWTLGANLENLTLTLDPLFEDHVLGSNCVGLDGSFSTGIDVTKTGDCR